MKQSVSLNAARAFIEAHFNERFATVFRQQYGSSPYRYLCGVRIQRAQMLLLEGVPGSVVATEVGFFDQSHFGRHFKRCCGMTPSMFIQQRAAVNAGKHGAAASIAKVSAPRSASAITSSC